MVTGICGFVQQRLTFDIGIYRLFRLYHLCSSRPDGLSGGSTDRFAIDNLELIIGSCQMFLSDRSPRHFKKLILLMTFLSEFKPLVHNELWD